MGKIWVNFFYSGHDRILVDLPETLLLGQICKNDTPETQKTLWVKIDFDELIEQMLKLCQPWFQN